MPRDTAEKRKAGNKLWEAILSGELPRAKELSCTDCGCPAHDYDHHLGYAPEHWFVFR